MIFRKGLNTIEMYDSVHNMPILRFRRWNKYAMQTSEIGSEFSDFSNRLNKITQFIQKDMKAEALNEIENTRMTVWNAIQEFSPKTRAFAIFIKSINGKSYEDFSPDSIDECIKHLSSLGITEKEAVDKLQEVKKKSKWNLWFTFQCYSRKMVTRNKPSLELTGQMS